MFAKDVIHSQWTGAGGVELVFLRPQFHIIVCAAADLGSQPIAVHGQIVDGSPPKVVFSSLKVAIARHL